MILFLATGCPRGIWLATRDLSPAFFFATRRYLAEAAYREWPLIGRHFSNLYFGFWPLW
jgi:hypothetical protein